MIFTEPLHTLSFHKQFLTVQVDCHIKVPDAKYEIIMVMKIQVKILVTSFFTLKMEMARSSDTLVSYHMASQPKR